MNTSISDNLRLVPRHVSGIPVANKPPTPCTQDFGGGKHYNSWNNAAHRNPIMIYRAVKPFRIERQKVFKCVHVFFSGGFPRLIMGHIRTGNQQNILSSFQKNPSEFFSHSEKKVKGRLPETNRNDFGGRVFYLNKRKLYFQRVFMAVSQISPAISEHRSRILLERSESI